MEREKEVYKVTLLGSLINLALMVFKFLAGIFGHSAAMIADAIHSVSDFVTDIVVLAFVRVSHRPKDKSHDYGHGKFETLATTLIGVALFAVAVGIFVDGAKKIVFWANGGTLTQPGILALVAALVSIVMKEAIFQYTKRKADQLDSQAMRANAWHHRSDALSSIGTAIGIGGAIILGERWAVLDPIASIVVGALIVKVAFDLLKNGMGELMEQSLPDEVENEILTIVKNVPGVFEPHDLCTRRIGNHYAIEMHILMDKDIALKEAHDRASEMERLLKERYGEETHISIHVEPREALAVKNKVRITAIRRTD
jgi:cation diffusion facilitator family transporter